MKNTVLILLGLCIGLARQSTVKACGGLFCGQPQPLQQQQPVDQLAERILFKVNANSVTMVVQISYAGSAPDFAWVLPMAQVPDPDSLSVFPQRALTTLDASTGLTFTVPAACFAQPARSQGQAALAGSAALPASSMAAAPVVTVHFTAEVGPYDVAAVESEDPMALFEWLQDNQFNVNESMLPYIRAYTEEGMKFIALKLQSDKESSDIQPFRFDLPGSTPSIPLRMTALAAEPEMSILVFVLGDRRYKGANWPDVEIDDKQIAWRLAGTLETNWPALVARGIDEAGGRGWVTELAGQTSSMLAMLRSSRPAAREDLEANEQLLELIGDSPFITRLHARLSAEEMTGDPIFHESSGGAVSNAHLLPEEVDGVNQCPGRAQDADPCLFNSCGAGGICRPVLWGGVMVAGCGCLAGATARATGERTANQRSANSAMSAATVACQDLRMSFVNPERATAQASASVDPCINFDCGPAGQCTSVNMTPTCVCDEGWVAIGGFGGRDVRFTRCEKPMVEVPAAFYAQRMPDLPTDLPGGRKLSINANMPIIQPRLRDLGSNSGAVPGLGSDRDISSGGCRVGAIGANTSIAALVGVVALAAVTVHRRRRRSNNC